VAHLGGEDDVRLGGGDGQRAGDGRELVLADEGRMGDVADVDAVLVVANDVLRKDLAFVVRSTSMRERGQAELYLGTEAVSRSADSLDSLGLKRLDPRDDDGVDELGRVGVLPVTALLDPPEEVKPLRLVQGDGVPVEDVEHQSGVPLGGEFVGHELAVLPDANDVGNVDDAAVLLVGLVGWRRGDVRVCLAVLELDDLAFGLAPREALARGESW
jgi:hypothetical protein